MEERNKKATPVGAELAQAAREYANKVWLNFDKEYENFSMSNKECGKLLPKDLLIWEVIHKAFEKGAEWMLEHPTGGELLHVCNKTAAITKKEMIDKACDVYCKLCDTKECVDDECNWVKKFKKAMEE